jgi:hypothetical protein
MIKKISMIGAVLFAAIPLMSCGGGDSKSADVKFTVPDSPVVIDSIRYTRDPVTGDPVSVAKPNFDFTYYFKNNSKSILYIATLNFKFTNTKNGATITGDYTLGPSAFCDPIRRRYLAIVPPGTEWRGDFLRGSADSCNEVYNTGEDEMALIGPLPSADNFSYAVEIIPQGFFTKDDGVTPDERYYGRSFMVTK